MTRKTITRPKSATRTLQAVETPTGDVAITVLKTAWEKEGPDSGTQTSFCVKYRSLANPETVDPPRVLECGRAGAHEVCLFIYSDLSAIVARIAPLERPAGYYRFDRFEVLPMVLRLSSSIDGAPCMSFKDIDTLPDAAREAIASDARHWSSIIGQQGHLLVPGEHATIPLGRQGSYYPAFLPGSFCDTANTHLLDICMADFHRALRHLMGPIEARARLHLTLDGARLRADNQPGSPKIKLLFELGINGKSAPPDAAHEDLEYFLAELLEKRLGEDHWRLSGQWSPITADRRVTLEPFPLYFQALTATSFGGLSNHQLRTHRRKIEDEVGRTLPDMMEMS